MSLIEEIINSVNIEDIISNYVNLKKSGRNFIGLCPFHNEKTPSFVVSPDKQIFKCFGCGKGGNVITFIKEIENVEFYDALKILAEKAGIDLKKYKNSFSKNEKDIEIKEKLLAINKAALAFFHKQIFENTKPLEYLEKERKLNKEIIIKYKLGYAPKDSQILIKYLKDKGFETDLIIKAGLAKKTSTGSLYSFFTNRIIFPIFNHLGEVVAFSGRIFEKESKGGKYINTPETLIYHKSNILYNYHNAKKTNKDYIIICEGYMDIIGLDRLGFDNAVATCGTSLTKNHILAVKRLSSNIIFSFDADQAGENATIRGLKIALENNVYPKIFIIEGGKDFDELANKGIKEINIWGKSEDSILYFINKYFKDYKKYGPVKKQEILEEIFNIIKHINNYSIFWDYLEIIGKKINQDPNILYQQFKNKKEYIKQDIKDNKYYSEYLIPSLFFNNFFLTLKLNIVEKYIEILLDIIDIIPDNNIIKKIFLNKISNEEKEKLLEKQLWREETLKSKKEEKKLTDKVANEIKIYFINFLKSLIKDPTITSKNKQLLIEKINILRK